MSSLETSQPPVGWALVGTPCRPSPLAGWHTNCSWQVLGGFAGFTIVWQQLLVRDKRVVRQGAMRERRLDPWECCRCAQDTERGRQASMATLLAEVSERAGPKPSREEAERLRQEVRPAPCAVLATPP